MASDAPVLFDASALVALFIPNSMSSVVRGYLRAMPRQVIVTDIAAGEFSAAVARHVRMSDFTEEQGRAVLSAFDGWRPGNAISIATEAVDIRVAESFVRRFELKLRLPDALYIATAQRLDATLLTFDETQALAAEMLGLRLLRL